MKCDVEARQLQVHVINNLQLEKHEPYLLQAFISQQLYNYKHYRYREWTTVKTTWNWSYTHWSEITNILLLFSLFQLPFIHIMSGVFDSNMS
jgi:hypothetical protein